MTEKRITVPKELLYKEIIRFIDALSSEKPKESFTFDFQKLSWTPPFGMLLFSVMLRNSRKSLPDVQFKADNFQHLTYQAHMGF